MEEQQINKKEQKKPIHRFKKGESGNPRGRPIGAKDNPERKAIKILVNEYRQALAEALPSIAPALVEKASDGDVPAIREIGDRIMGKPPQDITSDGKQLLPPIININDLRGKKQIWNNDRDGKDSEIIKED